ncbi:MAG: hypothetical protein IT475_18105 [Aquimonas sp.]|nr:hypothetical protein [Aquimonas sp.]
MSALISHILGNPLIAVLAALGLLLLLHFIWQYLRRVEPGLAAARGIACSPEFYPVVK